VVISSPYCKRATTRAPCYALPQGASRWRGTGESHKQAKSLELRATPSVSQLWQRQGKCTEARELLAPVYGWFAEGLTLPICAAPGHC